MTSRLRASRSLLRRVCGWMPKQRSLPPFLLPSLRSASALASQISKSSSQPRTKPSPSPHALDPMQRLAAQVQEAELRAQQQQQQQQSAAASEASSLSVSPASASSSFSSSGSDADADGYTPLPRYHSISWRFHSFATCHNMGAALSHLQHAARSSAEAALQPGSAGELDLLSCHDMSVYRELMRSFASAGDVEGCYALLTRLYQLAMHRGQLLPWNPRKRKESQKPGKPGASRPNKSRQQTELERRSNEQEESRCREADARRSPFTPDADLLAMVMTAYCHSPFPLALPETHHHQLISHHVSLQAQPTDEFHHSLLSYHSHHLSPASYLASLSLLSRCRSLDPPTPLLYSQAIRHYGLTRQNPDAALQIFLQLSSVAQANTAAYSTLIAVMARRGDWMLCWRLMRDMEEKRLQPNSYTYAGMLRALLQAGKEAEAVELYHWLRTVKRAEAVARVGAEAWTDSMYVTMMQWWEVRREQGRLSAVWRDMQADGVEPQRNAFTCLMKAKLRQGDLQEARQTLRDMQSKGSRLVWHLPAYYTALRVQAAAGDWTGAMLLYRQLLSYTRQLKRTVPHFVFLVMLTATSGAQQLTTAGAEVVARRVLSLLRDQQRLGLVPANVFQRSACELLRRCDSPRAALKLSTAFVRKRMTLTEAIINELEIEMQADRDDASERKRKGSSVAEACADTDGKRETAQTEAAQAAEAADEAEQTAAAHRPPPSPAAL